MELFECLPERDKRLFHKYISEFSEAGAMPYDQLGRYLRFWNENKRTFYQAFGEEFIIKKEISLTKTLGDGENEMRHKLGKYYADPIIRTFVNHYQSVIQNIMARYLYDDEMYNNLATLKYMVDDYEALYENVYYGEGFTIPGEFTVNGKPFVVNKNAKLIKLIGRLVKALGADIERHICPLCNADYPTSVDSCPNCSGAIVNKDIFSGFEMYRQAHSQVLNTKRVKGTLCLSIHPMDFVTMSDNACDWETCMSWMSDNDGGEYRLGTVEMMNSSYVIVAYLESKDPMYLYCNFGDEEKAFWNSKKWRQLYIVDEIMILGNRQYPYNNDEIQGAAIKWIRDLMTKMPGFGPYADTTSKISNRNHNAIGDKDVQFYIETSGIMYNDVYDFRLAYLADQKLQDGDLYEINFSGPAVCAACGCEIYSGNQNPQNVCCSSCSGGWECDLCGDAHRDCEDSCHVDGYTLCQYCWEDRTEICEICDEVHIDNVMEHYYIQWIGANDPEVCNFNFSYYVPICNMCVSSKEIQNLYGEVHTVYDFWHGQKKAFDVRNITDEGLNRGNLMPSTVKLLKAMRDAESEEDCVRLIREIAC